MANEKPSHLTAGTPRTLPASAVNWLPLIALPGSAIAARIVFPEWVFMWVLALSIFFGCKWLTWRRAAGASAGTFRSLAYLLFWPGMDAADFLYRASKPAALRDWIVAAAKAALGIALLAFASVNVIAQPQLAGQIQGWLGMAGAVLLLHFGVFHMIALGYAAAGIPAKPLMQSPASATSLADFWGRRWNTAFNRLAHDFVFRPLSRRTGAFGATLAVFLVSGLIHDLVISLPARGGYGQPTAYFLMQGLAVVFEHSGAGHTIGLGRGWRGWVFALAVTCLPLPLLFHSPFVHNVVLPMLHAIGGAWRAL